jgi:hypothetical protein
MALRRLISWYLLAGNLTMMKSYQGYTEFHRQMEKMNNQYSSKEKPHYKELIRSKRLLLVLVNSLRQQYSPLSML